MEKTQMLKGILEGAILAILTKEEIYGYEMVKRLEAYGLNSVSDGSIYPVLLKLQKQGHIEGIKKKSSEGPTRKYYYLTDQGKKELTHFKKQWQELAAGVNHLLEE
ncbi:PadR family transcriptional regulator [Vagococcus entomophilus]|uniref:PadR family transcriptional regulator n=1 Tax=Vagococcus entomophilus TaxID=1160095 RepID=A0A430AH40_9ENTE|nr:PadR family transcriptional regulator [Vagococcus entomophilus]RSU07242.1 PadR family transcriptional regulator [Vagococcus entomophilus]